MGNIIAFPTTGNASTYRQKVGIPQGSMLSCLLCSLFYGHMDRRHLGRFLKDPSSLLMRFVDDFIFITRDEGLAGAFVDTLSQGSRPSLYPPWPATC